MSKIISSRIRHQVQFAPDPNRTGFPTEPIFVETRLIRDITNYPEKVKYVSFDDIVEICVQIPNGPVRIIYSEPFNNSGHYLISWDPENIERLSREWFDALDVNPTVNGKVYVIPTSLKQCQEQRTAETAT